jgi:tRNA 2-thiouridine synthesizing protein D
MAKMKILICVNNSAHHSPGGRSAHQFAVAALEQGHTIDRVFFYHDGVLTGSAFSSMPGDQSDLTAQWQQLADQHGIDLVLCIGAGLRRGVVDELGAKEARLPGANLASGFRIAGLGQWMEAAIEADRVIRFGSGGL